MHMPVNNVARHYLVPSHYPLTAHAYPIPRPTKSHALGVILTHSRSNSHSHANSGRIELYSHTFYFTVTNLILVRRRRCHVTRERAHVSTPTI